MKRQPSDEATLLRRVLENADGMLKYYDMRLSYSIDIKDNSYTIMVNPADLEPAGVLTRLRRCTELESIMADIVSARDPVALERAIQRGRCLIDDRALRPVS